LIERSKRLNAVEAWVKLHSRVNAVGLGKVAKICSALNRIILTAEHFRSIGYTSLSAKYCTGLPEICLVELTKCFRGLG